MVKKLFAFLRTTAFLATLCFALITTTIGLAAWAVSLTTQVATVTASAAASAVAHRKALAAAAVQRKKAVAKAVNRTKAKARLRRVVVVVPFAGLAAAAAFEHQDYLEWKKDNPEGDLQEYGCEVSALSAEVIDEVLQELPQQVRPSPELVLSQLPDCNAAD